MAHEIEQFEDGTAAFVTAREHAWHRLGVTLDDTFTPAQAMEHAHLGGWNVRKEALTSEVITPDGVTRIDVPGHYASVRTHPKTGQPEALGVVGERYVPVQNEESAEFLGALVDEGGAHLETAGSLRDGRHVFFTCKLPNTITVAGTDEIDLYVALLNSHDGSTGFRAIVSPVRIVCANTQAMALRSARQSWSIRHTSGAKAAITEARRSLGMTFEYAEEFERAAERMISETLTARKWDAALDKLFGKVDKDAPLGRQNAKIERLDVIRGLYTDADTQANCRGTRWGGYQAIVEYMDHYRPIKDDDAVADARALRAVYGSSWVAKNAAYEALKV